MVIYPSPELSAIGHMATGRAHLQAELQSIKEAGNKRFAAGKFSSAADLYTEAIALLPSELSVERLVDGRGSDATWMRELRPVASVIYSNRAYCWKALGSWREMEEDADRALTMDKLNAKVGARTEVCAAR